ncbi:cytochrome C oxidase subunit IV family protein [Xanthomarina sp. F2636L]|uniref:cytochrome C oxidase subunit IV family protein n=1 Tax=Xanthomarina sp. F2636L TaxID=2996018 RepID=UPI00225E1B68|nr:cytochrome C oxidase subunit IV family protein [Xanthomarina sp. F2636L]MCX7551490.1 cytochrome C oxidase subunit IV family protein [Xanthomarina sp. F2636L]
MKKLPFLIVLIILVILTVLSALVSNSGIGNGPQYIMLLSALKFLAVAFYFMELRHANTFWKVLLIGCLTIFIGLVLII